MATRHDAPLEVLRRGQVFTPEPVARRIVREALDGWALLRAPEARAGGLTVIDPACGDGALVRAAVAELGAAGVARGRWVGVEVDPEVRVEAPGLGLGGDDGDGDGDGARSWRGRVLRGDALALAAQGAPELADGGAELVVLNPPYIGEKGHRGLFQAAARLGPRWAARTQARMDYLYYFIHLGLDLLRPGGRLVALTTAYWPSASGAEALREALVARGRVVGWLRFEGAAIWASSRGQHNLAVVVERRAAGEAGAEAASWSGRYRWTSVRVSAAGGLRDAGRHEEVPAARWSGAPWQPFVSAREARWAQEVEARWPTLGQVVADHQGIVSGCDRVAQRHARGASLALGAPVFCLTGDEVAARGWADDPEVRPLLRPLVRGAQIEARGVIAAQASVTDPQARVMLYLDRGVAALPEALRAHLEPVREVLERRREVQAGVMPWWGLHWPRSAAAMAAPKLITARRGDRVRVALDVSGSAVSSDCTFMTLRAGDGGGAQAARALEGLAEVWLTLHGEAVARWVAARGKRKGRMVEFYSQPLRALRVPMRWDARGGVWRGVPEWGGAEPEAVRAALERLQQAVASAT